MEEDSWRPAQQNDSAAGAGGDEPDWRSQLHPESRHRIVTKIMDTLKRHVPPNSSSTGLPELQSIAARFEEKTYSTAVSQPDYLRKISLKMLSMETKTQQSAPTNPAVSNNPGANQNRSELASLAMQPQGSNQGQPQPMAMVNQTAARQQILHQNIQNNNLNSVQGSANIPSGLPSISGSGQSTLSGVGMPGIGQNSAANPVGQAAVPDIYANSQRLQGRQQQTMTPQQQQSQNQLLYHQQQQQQFQRQLKQKMQSPVLQPHMQQQQHQQQTVMPTTQLQSSQPLMQMSASPQSGQATIQQTQNGLQQASQPGMQQNPLSSSQQAMPSLLQQHSQSISRQQQAQASMLHPTGTQAQKPNLAPQQHGQQLLGSQQNISSIQQAQLLGQQTSISDMQQAQRMPVQQNNLLGIQQPQHMLNQQTMSLHQQQSAGPQSNSSSFQHQHQHGPLTNVSNMQHQRSMPMLQQSKAAASQQQQIQQSPMTMLQPQAQQTQPQSSQQQQFVSHFQSQPMQVQQHSPMQQPSPLPREMQEMLHSGALLSQNAIEQHKQIIQSQRGVPDVSSSTSVESTSQTGQNGNNDWQEEIYQKIKSMKARYFNDLNEICQKIALKLQQADSLIPPVKQLEQYEKMKKYKTGLDQILNILQISKANIQLALKDRLPLFEKQIISVLTTNKKRPAMSAQIQLQPSGAHAQSMPQPQSQVPHLTNHINQSQQLTMPVPTASMQSVAGPGVQHGYMSLSNHFGISTSQQNMTNILQPGPTTDSVQGNSFTSLPQGSVGSIQTAGISVKGTMNIPQQMNNNLTHSSISTLPGGGTSMLPSNVMQHQHFKQQQHHEQHQNMMQTQQLKQQMQQHQQQQMMQQHRKQQLHAQQQLHQQFQQKQQQAVQMPASPQLHQTNEINDLKMRQGPPGGKTGMYQQHYSGGPRLNYYQQVKPAAPFPISSPQNLQALSPQISHQSSSQIDQQSLLTHVKVGTPLQSANSPFAPSPSTPIAPSPIPGDSEKPVSGTAVPEMPNSGHVGHQPTTTPPTQSQSHPVAIPGMSASPLLAEFSIPNANQTNSNIAATGKPSASESPFERLLRVLRNSSPIALSSAVKEIASVISMTDRIAGSAPGNGSRAGVGEDLVSMSKCRLQARNSITQEGSSAAKKMKRDTRALALNSVSSVGSISDSLIKLHGLDSSELELTATSCAKRHKAEVNHSICEEIKEINQQLIDTEVSIVEEDANTLVSALEGEGVVIQCSYLGVALSPSLKSHMLSSQISLIQPLRLLVPANYPNSSPILLDKSTDDQCRNANDLSFKAKTRFRVSLRGLSQPMSLQEMVKTWDACIRKVITEYAEHFGGGTFSSTYGFWENCVGA